jgi:hypothetical protein
MHLFCLRRAFLLTSFLVALPGAALAQGDWNQPWSDPRDRPGRVDLSLSGGYDMATDWSSLTLLGTSSPATGVVEQVIVRDLRVDPDQVFGGAFTYWKAKYGFRVNVARSDSTLVSGATTVADVKSWFYDVRGTVGMVDYHPSRLAYPYFFVGLGAITYDLSQPIGPPLTSFIEHNPSLPVSNLSIINRGGRQFVLQEDTLSLETVAAFNLGLGTDFRVPLGPSAVGIRAEVSDTISPSPLEIRLQELSSSIGEPAQLVNVGFGAVHHLRASVGLVIQLGR